jgi:hypothetical protein
MKKHVSELRAEELERLAREAWSNAARQALGKGLSITGSRNGRRYRHDADGRVEDLGSVAEATALPKNSEVETAEALHAAAANFALQQFSIPVIELPRFEVQTFVGPPSDVLRAELPAIPVVEMPAAFRIFAERGVAQARDAFEKTTAAAEEAANVILATYTGLATKGASEYGLKVIEIARSNTTTTFQFASDLTAARTLTQVIELSSAHIRKQFELLSLQSRELAALTEKVVIEVSEHRETSKEKNSPPVRDRKLRQSLT